MFIFTVNTYYVEHNSMICIFSCSLTDDGVQVDLGPCNCECFIRRHAAQRCIVSRRADQLKHCGGRAKGHGLVPVSRRPMPRPGPQGPSPAGPHRRRRSLARPPSVCPNAVKVRLGQCIGRQGRARLDSARRRGRTRLRSGKLCSAPTTSRRLRWSYKAKRTCLQISASLSSLRN